MDEQYETGIVTFLDIIGFSDRIKDSESPQELLKILNDLKDSARHGVITLGTQKKNYQVISEEKESSHDIAFFNECYIRIKKKNSLCFKEYFQR